MKITDLEDQNRSNLAVMFKELGFKVGAEIGVDRGLYAQEMCEANPGVKLYCIDPWKTYSEYTDFEDQHVLNINCQNTKRRLSPYNAVVICDFSIEAVKDFADNSLDFVYIDGNHNFKYVLEDLHAWVGKVKTGGIISGHDYLWRAHRKHVRTDVKDALAAYLKDQEDTELFLLTKKGSSSWYFIKK